GSPAGRATHRVTACGRHARGRKPYPWCRTICRRAIRKCGERSRQATGSYEFGQSGTCELLSLQSGPLASALSSPEDRHSCLSYRHMFFLCSISIRINGATNEMASLNHLTTITVACLATIAASSQQVRAQEFTLFEHAIIPPKAENQAAREYLPAIYQAGPADVSYREGLYM